MSLNDCSIVPLLRVPLMFLLRYKSSSTCYLSSCYLSTCKYLFVVISSVIIIDNGALNPRML
jgi:hypothetical protein